MKRSAAIRQHQEDAAYASRMAEQATGPTREELLTQAEEHQGLADAARHYDYPTDLEG